MTGEAGIALIAKRALEMGHLFHPRRVDHGIDGHLDLVDPASGEHLNSTVPVQSKASDRSFQNENDQGFTYLCDQRDLDHWLGGNAPVILVLSHPQQDKAWWADVKAAYPDAKTRASRRIQVDKNRQAFDRTAGTALLALGMPASSGLYLQPPPRPEVLDTNLLAITGMPEDLYLAPAGATTYRQAGELLDGVKRAARGPFILRGGMVISFSDLREAGLNRLCAGDVEVHETREWAGATDTDTLHAFQDLLSRTIQDSYPELRWHGDRRHVHFRATVDLSARRVGKGPGTPGRTVFGPHHAKNGSGVAYYHHAAVRMRMRRIGSRWYCELNPDYCFTSDGTQSARYEDSLISGIKRFERHPSVAGWVRMWARFLRGTQDLFTTPTPIQFGDLLSITVESGIDDSLWGPAPAGDANADNDDPDTDALAASEVVEEEVAEILSLFGMSTHGPADLMSASEPRAIRVGLVGGATEVEGLHAWLERCKDPIEAKDERYPHLFPAFPGCDIDRGLYTTLVLSDRVTNIVSPKILNDIDAATGARALELAVDAHCEEARSLAEQNRVDVILIARPEQLRDTATRARHTIKPLPEPTTPNSAVDADVSADVAMKFANFHDLVKARLLSLTPPIQIIRRSTWDEATRPPTGYSRQDEASRAWNGSAAPNCDSWLGRLVGGLAHDEFVLDRGQAAERGLASTAVVGAFDPGDDRDPELISGVPAVAVEDVVL